MTREPVEVVASAPDLAPHADGSIFIEYCGEWTAVAPGTIFGIGRDADLAIDDNPFLHRRLLEISQHEGVWFIHNVGSRLVVTVADGDGRLQSWLAPGGRLPLVFGRLTVVFTAGPTTYDFVVHIAEPSFEYVHPLRGDGTTTVGDVTLTLTQKQLILSLAEPMLLREGSGMAEIPTSGNAAKRLGWAMSRFNRKLDNVCDKLDRMGVQGMYGGARAYATNRRLRLVEYAIAARLVTRDDLPLLDLESDE